MARIKEVQTRRFREFKEFVLEQLQDPEFALAYLNESLKEDDQESFLNSLRNVVEAHSGDISLVAQKANLSRQNLYRILSKEGNPKLTSVRSLLHVLGLELAVQPYSKNTASKKKKTVTSISKRIKRMPVKSPEISSTKVLQAKKRKSP